MGKRTNHACVWGIVAVVLTTITARTTVGTQAYSLGAAPLAILIWTDGQAAATLTDGYRFLQGMSDGVTQVCRSVAMDDSGASPNGVQVDAPGYLYRMAATVASGAAAIIQQAQLVSFDADGFTLDWQVVDGNATRIQVLAFTADEVDAANLVAIYCDGNPEVITGIGFTASLVITLGGTTTGLVPYALGPFCAMPTFGFSDGLANYSGDSVGRFAGGTTPGAELFGGGSTTPASTVIRFISSIFEGFVATGIRIANVVPDGFDASKGGFGAFPLYHYFLALSSPLQVAIGSVDQPASGSVDLGLDFDPAAMLLMTTGARMVAGGVNTKAAYAFGAWLADGTTRHAFTGATRAAGVNDTARHNGTGPLKLYAPAPAGGSSTLVLDVSVINDGAALSFDTSDGGLRSVVYVAFGVPPEPPDRCSGGTVPQVPDPADGYAPEGLGPHEDRFFIETDLDSGTERWALHNPMRDSPALTAHAGHKAGLITQSGSIVRRSTDRIGSWQASNARWAADDRSRRIRGLIATNYWYNREFRPYLTARTDVENARCLGRFIIQEYPPTVELAVEVEGVDIINTEFSPFNLDRDILGSVVFSRVYFAGLPDALGDLDPKQPVPVYGGRWSDGGSRTGTAPVMQGMAWRGASVPDPGQGYWVMGFHEMPAGGPAPPDSVIGTAIPGGNINLSDTAYNQVYVCVWGVTAGVEGDPFPFYAQQIAPVVISANGSKVRVDWTFAGTDPDYWRIGFAPRYYGARWNQYLQVVGSARTCAFTDTPRFGGGGIITPGAVVSYANRGEYKAVAVMPDGKTAASTPFVIMQTGPYARPAHVSWIPVDGALSYDVYKAYVPNQYFGIREKFSVPADQIDSDGLAYFVDDWVTVGESVTEIDGPAGMLPVWDVGDELLNGEVWGALVLCRWPVAEIEEVRQGADDITDHADVLHPDHANWSTYFSDRFVTKAGVDFTILYARNAILAKHRAAVGGTTAETSDVTAAPIQVNACTTEDIGDGTGNVITIGPRLVQHMLAELIRNDHITGLWNGIPAFDDGVYEIRTSSYLQAENTEVTRIGEGYPCRMAFIAPTTVRQFFELCAQGLGLHHAIDHHGRVRCGHYDDAIDLTATYRHLKDVREITGHIRTTPLTAQLENRIPYQADFRPIDKAYALRDIYVEDAAAIIANRGKVKPGPERQTQFAASATTWTDVLARALMLGKYVRTWVEVPTGIPGINVDIFDVFQVTDEAGITASGWDGQYILCLEHEIIPGDPSVERPTTVVLKGLDITAIVSAAFVWAPDEIPATWDLMTDAQRTLYGAFADTDGTIPTDGAPGKEWR